MNDELLSQWFIQNPFGHYLCTLEQSFFQEKLNHMAVQTVLQIGMLSWEFKKPIEKVNYFIQPDEPQTFNSIRHGNHCLPWEPQSMDMIIWPHGLDKNNLEQTINKIAQTLKVGGKLLLTGFNRSGYWRLLYRKGFLSKFNLYRAGHVIQQLHKYHFVLSEGQFLGYSLMGKNIHNFHHIELMGNRWWPHLAAVYALVLEKRSIPLIPIIDYQLAPAQPVLAGINYQINKNI